MTNNHFFKKTIVALLVTTAFSVTQLSPLWAALVGTEQLLHPPASQSLTVSQMLAEKQARQALARFGVEPADIERRLAQLTEVERQQLQEQIAAAPAGGDALSILLTVFIVFVITDVLGATDIFPFVHPIK